MHTNDRTIDNQAAMPSRSDIQRESGGASWRFADGRICRGRESALETRPDIYGRLRRVGIHQGVVPDTGRPYMQIEADIEDEDGQIVHCHSSLLDDYGQVKSSVPANNLAWALLQFEPGELILLEAGRSAPYKNSLGKEITSTYVNASRIKVGEDGVVRATKLMPPRSEKNGPRRTTLDRWLDLEPHVRRHPAFAERPARREDSQEGAPGATHLGVLGQECAAKGWPSPQQAPAEWLAMLGAAFGEPARASLASYDDDTWGQVRQMLAGQTEMPAALEPALARIQPAAAPSPAPAPTLNASAFGARA